MAGEDNMAEHSFMMEPKIKNKLCMGKMDRLTVQTDHGAGEDNSALRLLTNQDYERNMHGKDGRGPDETTVRSDHVAGEDNMAEHSLMLEPKIKKEYAWVRWKG